jgi:hypothetical protein
MGMSGSGHAARWYSLITPFEYFVRSNRNRAARTTRDKWGRLVGALESGIRRSAWRKAADTGSRAGKPLADNPRRQIMTTIELFYSWMYDNRAEAAATLDEQRWLALGPAHSVLFRPGDNRG